MAPKLDKMFTENGPFWHKARKANNFHSTVLDCTLFFIKLVLRFRHPADTELYSGNERAKAGSLKMNTARVQYKSSPGGGLSM
jgi:hypothetical protein